jgi:outer membrane biogenesis lipoprotein LolB
MTRFLLPSAAAFLLAACSAPTSTEPKITSSGGAGPTVEYSGERSGQADAKAQEACAAQGKRAVPRSMQPGPSGGNVRSYDCAP